jgi:hypothetical protein
LTKRTIVTIVSIAVLAFLGSVALSPAIQSLKDQQDRNFAAALQRDYGATSSQPFSEINGLGSIEGNAVLTRDGVSTNVRFEVKDNVLTPIALTEAPYPKPAGKS